jgi:hypothetical protein
MQTPSPKSRRYLQPILCLLLALGMIGRAEAEDVDPWRLRAAFLYNFSQFIEWPAEAFADAAAPFNICVLGPNRFGNTLNALEKRTVRGHPISTLSIARPADARGCHILYLADARASAGKSWTNLLGSAPVLVVGDTEESRDTGTGISFIEQGGKLRWAINLGILRPLNLKVSAKLLEIAVAVIGE